MTLYHGILPAEFMVRAQAAGMRPEQKHKDTESYTVSLTVHGCKALARLLVPSGGGRFSSVQFWAGWQDDFTPDEANFWNTMRRYAFAYSDESGHANLQMDISVVGLSDEGLDHYLGLWAHMVASFMTEMA